MRLDLPRYNCVSFELHGEFTSSEDCDALFQDLMERTYVQQMENATAAVFASRYTVQGTTHRVQGALIRTEDDEESKLQLSIIFVLAPSSLSRPPRDIRPVSLLIGVAPSLVDEIQVDCSASFKYETSDGYRSKVTLPIALPIESDHSGVTHIESAEFSRRDGDNAQYRVAVFPPDDTDAFQYIVGFDDNLRLDPPSIRRLLSKASTISNSLVTRTEGD